jgi:hypothetical protein
VSRARRNRTSVRAWWHDNGTLVAVIGLLVTMVFNTLGIWQQVDQSKLAHEQAQRAAEQAIRTRIDTQIGLLTQVSALAADAESAVLASRVQQIVCRFDDPSVRQEAAVYRAAELYDYLAWLFNERQLELESAKQYATPAMLSLYELALETLDKNVEDAYPELSRFSIAAPRSARPRDPCE